MRRLVFGPIAASFIIAAGWQWYHFPHRPHWRIIVYTLVLAAIILVVYTVFKKAFHYLVVKFERHPFWADDFFYLLDNLFFIVSLYFLVFFSRHEVVSLLYFAAISVLLFAVFDNYLGRHPAPGWRKAGRVFFILTSFIFIVEIVFQYFAFANYILDPNIRFYNIVLFRSVSMAALWLCGFALSSLLYVYLIGRRIKFAFVIVWTALFVASIFIGVANIGVLYHTSLYLNPIVLEHAQGDGFRVFLFSGILLTALFAALSTVALIVISGFYKTHRVAEHHVWFYFDLGIVFITLAIILSVASIRSTPEAKIILSFYDYWRGANPEARLEPVVQQKLKRFGIAPDLNNFYINSRDTVYSTSSKLLPDRLIEKKPNIVIVFLESYSSRLTDVYNPELKDITPGLSAMASDPDTTIFKNFYSASTPTITGLIAQLCSFLPPTGHNEIENSKQLQKHHLSCLPEVLAKDGYKDSLYITAVAKDYASKDTILASMGVKNTWGTHELSQRISGEPLAWGYSDHQMFPALLDEMKIKKTKGEEPFLAMLSTVDTHPPFNLVKDVVPYGDGKDNLLNTIHTTDDAFKIFWEQFKASELASSTILVAVADHAIFATAYEENNFPELVGKMTYYDDIVFMMYVPDSILPSEVDTYSSSIDLTPTLLQVLGINKANVFEGHSIFDDREEYPNLLGMHEFGLWINQKTGTSSRQIDYAPPMNLSCTANDIGEGSNELLNLCEYLNYFQWKRLMFEQGRMWMPAL